MYKYWLIYTEKIFDGFKAMGFNDLEELEKFKNWFKRDLVFVEVLENFKEIKGPSLEEYKEFVEVLKREGDNDIPSLMAVKQFLEQKEGWDLDELISEMVEETNLLKHKGIREYILSTDECSIEWGGDTICTVTKFVDSYTEIFIKKICSILDSFIEEDISC